MSRIHASDVTYEPWIGEGTWCPRRHALLQITGKPQYPDLIGTASALTYSQGTGLAGYVVRKALKAGIAVGDWNCRVCMGPGDPPVAQFTKRPGIKCNQCGYQDWRYLEVRVRSLKTGISCGIDLIVKLPGWDHYRIVEIKTVGKDEFVKKLKAVKQEHRERTQLYLRCFQESDHPVRHAVDPDEALVLYISKEGWGEKTPAPREWGLRDQGWTPFKQFTVRRNDEAIQHHADAATPLWKWQQGKAGLPEGVCATQFCQQAKRCEVFDECWGGRYRAGQHKLKDPLV